ncbi:MAG: nitrous oxide reductase family maturation protein NosD [Phycisphaerales bacterium JB047]
MLQFTRTIPLAIILGVSHALGAPASDIQSLIDDAAPGSVVEPAPGVYEGALRITKPITIDGRGVVTIDAGGEGSVIEVSAPDVALRGLIICGSGKSVSDESAGIKAIAGPVTIEDNRISDVYFGIDLKQSPGSIIRRNSIEGKDLELGRRGDGIRLWWSHGCTIEHNTVRDSRDMVFWYSEDLKIENNSVINSRYGLHFMYSHNTAVRENRLSGNSVGIYLMYSNAIRLVQNQIDNNRGTSGYGIGLKDCDDIEVDSNLLAANRVGIYIDNSPSSADSIGLIRSNKIAFNEVGLLATPNTHDNTIYDNGFIENEEQVSVHGGGQLFLNEFASEEKGNFWSDYNGFDRDNDGLGEFAYEPRSLFRTMLAREPNLRLFVHSPAQQAIELTARAFPELDPDPMLSDPRPLVLPPRFELPSLEAGTGGLRMALVSGGLLLLSVLVMLRLSIERTHTPASGGQCHD